MRTGSVLELGLLEAGFSEQIGLKELEVELRRLELKEKEITCHFEVKKLEEETKRVLRLKELEISVAVPQQVHTQLPLMLLNTFACCRFFRRRRWICFLFFLSVLELL